MKTLRTLWDLTQQERDEIGRRERTVTAQARQFGISVSMVKRIRAKYPEKRHTRGRYSRNIPRARNLDPLLVQLLDKQKVLDLPDTAIEHRAGVCENMLGRMRKGSSPYFINVVALGEALGLRLVWEPISMKGKTDGLSAQDQEPVRA